MKRIEISPTLHLYIEPIDRRNANAREAEREAIRKIMSELYGSEVKVEHTPDGAPYIAGARHKISISHCRTTAGIVICTDGRTPGLDLETADRAGQLNRVAARFLSPEEMESWVASPLRLLQAWTLKEAAFKAAERQSADLRNIHLPQDGCLIKAAADYKPIPLETLRIVFSEPVDYDTYCSVVVNEQA